MVWGWVATPLTGAGIFHQEKGAQFVGSTTGTTLERTTSREYGSFVYCMEEYASLPDKVNYLSYCDLTGNEIALSWTIFKRPLQNHSYTLKYSFEGLV